MAKNTAPSSQGCDQLKTDLKQKALKPFYVLCGEEDYLCYYYLNQMKKQLLDDVTRDFNYHHLTQENFSVETLADSLEALPMMAEKTMIQMDDIDLFALPEEDRDRIIDLLGDLPDYCCLVLFSLGFNPDKRKKKLWTAIEKNGVIAHFPYQKPADLRAWTVRHFKALGKYIAPGDASYLVEQCGCSMSHINGEIEKLCHFCSGEQVTRADIDALVEPTLEAEVFKIADELTRKNFDTAFQKLNGVLKAQSEPILVLGAMGSQLRRLRLARVLLQEGGTAQDLSRMCGISAGMAGATMNQARQVSDRFCRRAVLLCRDCDAELKSSREEPQKTLIFLVMQLAEDLCND